MKDDAVGLRDGGVGRIAQAADHQPVHDMQRCGHQLLRITMGSATASTFRINGLSQRRLSDRSRSARGGQEKRHYEAWDNPLHGRHCGKTARRARADQAARAASPAFEHAI